MKKTVKPKKEKLPKEIRKTIKNPRPNLDHGHAVNTKDGVVVLKGNAKDGYTVGMSGIEVKRHFRTAKTANDFIKKTFEVVSPYDNKSPYGADVPIRTARPVPKASAIQKGTGRVMKKNATDKKEIAVKQAIKKTVSETNAHGFQIPSLVKMRLSGATGGNASHDYITRLYSQMRKNGEI